MLIGVSTFLAWVFPIIYLLTVHYVIISYDGEVPPQDISTILLVLQQFLGVFMSVNSAVNPIIYSFTQKPFKENFAKVFHQMVNQCGCSKLPARSRKNTITTQVVSFIQLLLCIQYVYSFHDNLSSVAFWNTSSFLSVALCMRV